ncbi:hypothetical protein ACEWX3_21305 [Mycobacterium sp. G7A2]|uniref:hypothetical protein n=1 Tax=Mycobacterium sp. G7A2 TaxID=3317307 RepID=UPI0035A9296E
MNFLRDLTTVVAVNNAISAELARQDLVLREIPLKSVALVLLRDVTEPWMEQCGLVLRYPGRPASGLLGQWRFIGFYRAAARLLRDLEKRADIRHIYLVNNDSLITAHLFSIAEHRPSIEVSVVVEGIMNFQEISLSNRARWRWQIKPMAARLLGYRYRQPRSHLSGAFEPRTSRIISFALEGLKAPENKVVRRTFQPVEPPRKSDPKIALVVLTGLHQWMEVEKFEFFAQAFVAWLENSGFQKIQVKKHPRIPGGLIEELLEGHEEVGVGVTTESMAADLEAGTVVGTCCTALVTFKLMRPDLRCIDFGSDYYSEHAYHGDNSVKTLLSATGVTLIQMPGSYSQGPTMT